MLKFQCRPAINFSNVYQQTIIVLIGHHFRGRKQIKISIFLPGDCCATGETKLAMVAQEHAKHLASNLIKLYQGKSMKPYRPSTSYFCVINNATRYALKTKTENNFFEHDRLPSSTQVNSVCSILEKKNCDVAFLFCSVARP